jgi:hypothetical protein
MKLIQSSKAKYSTMSSSKPSSRKAGRKIREAIGVLKALGFPREQQNERSALTLLSLLNLKPQDSWTAASDPLMGITPMMEFFSREYGKTYAPNSRETVRRFTVHQFLQAGLITENPDEPSRPTNSPKAVYQIEARSLEMLKKYGTDEWPAVLLAYRSSIEPLKRRYDRDREMQRIPVELAKGKSISLSPGGHNLLVKLILDEFAPRFTPGAKIVYVGDTKKKWAYFDSKALDGMGVVVDEHGKMPDVVIHDVKRNWLVLIEAVTSHGPVNPKRRAELKELFAKCSAGLVFVTAFPDRKTMVKCLGEISWETEVWLAESPTHLIHFNGVRFLGPYDD